MHRLLWAAAGGLLACAPADEAAQTSASTAVPDASITFEASWNERVEGPLVAGGKLTVHYDPARLAQCEGEQGGMLQWAITGHWQSGGTHDTFDVISPNRPDAGPVTIPLDSPGRIELWFEATNRWGCHAYDSEFGNNYGFDVGAPDTLPSWAGNAASVIARYGCGEEPCADDLRPLSDGFLFDTWARQRATIANLYFEAWEPGVTDRDNPDLWQQLDVQLHHRFDPAAQFETTHVDFDRKTGNNARYVVALRELDPVKGNTITDPSGCPNVSLVRESGYVRATLEYYFTVSDLEVRPAPGKTFGGVFEDYAGLYAPCFPE